MAPDYQYESPLRPVIQGVGETCCLPKTAGLRLYNNRKRIVSITSSIIFGIGFVILFSMLIAFNFKILFLILELSIILLNFIYLFASFSFLLLIFKRNFYSLINENIIVWIKKEKKDIKIENINVNDLKISSKESCTTSFDAIAIDIQSLVE